MQRDRERLRERLGAFGISESAKDWVVKTLDPAVTLTTKGVPDSTSCAVMRPEYTIQFNIATPVVPTPTWDCYIVFIPGNMNSAIYAYGPGGTDFGTSTAPANTGVGWIPLENSNDVGPGTKWMCTDISAGGPYPASVEALFDLRVPSSNPATFRHVYKSATIDLVAPAVANQGDVFCGQYSPEFRRRGRPNAQAKAGTDFVWMVNECALPVSEDALTLSSRNPYVGLAKDGVYVPLKHPGPTMSFADVGYFGGVGTGSNITVVGGGGLATCTIAPIDGYGVQYPMSFNVANNDSGGPTGSESPWINTVWGDQFIGFDTGYDNTNVAVVIFRGLAAGGGGGGFGASLLLKVKVGLEVCPRPTTASRIYVQPPHPYEPRAIEAYYALAAEMAAAYPSSYNALGLLMPALSSIASRLVGPFMSGASAFMRELTGAPQREARPKLIEKETIRVSRPARTASVRSARSTGSRVALKPALKSSRRKKRS